MVEDGGGKWKEPGTAAGRDRKVAGLVRVVGWQAGPDLPHRYEDARLMCNNAVQLSRVPASSVALACRGSGSCAGLEPLEVLREHRLPSTRFQSRLWG